LTSPGFRLASGSVHERRMSDTLRGLASRYDLGPWTFTDTLVIEEGALPHSHPVLTVGTEHWNDPPMALAQWLHEQLHWFEEQRADRRDEAILATRGPYPVVPDARPEGAGNENSTRLHLIVCWLELQALARLLDPAAACGVARQLCASHYRWVYRTVMRDARSMGELIATHGLLPEPLIGMGEPLDCELP
jgi:hypothetical protein